MADMSGTPDKVIAKLTDRSNLNFYRDIKNTSCGPPSGFDLTSSVTGEEVAWLVEKTREIISNQPMFLELDAPITIIADVHGQFRDFILMLDCMRMPPEANYLFLGDYVDRGLYSVECIAFVMALKVKYPTSVFTLRGNHECAASTKTYGFQDECRTRFPKFDLWQAFMKLFNFLPVAALVDNKLFCCHGGLSPDLHTWSDIQKLKRPSDIPQKGLMADLCWADPDRDIRGWDTNTDRGISYVFGPDIVQKFCNKHNLTMVVRAHQVVKNGFEFFAQKRLCTMFSAPNYCGVFKNDAAVMHVAKPFKLVITRLKFKDKEAKELKKRCENIPVTTSDDAGGAPEKK